MPATTLAAAGATSILAGASFVLVARAVSNRGATGERLLARRAHTLWWLGLGAYLLLQGGLTLAASADALGAPLYMATRILLIPVLCAATWGITFYLAFLYTGNDRAARPLALLYVAVAALFYYATFSVPQQLIVETWIVTLDDHHPLYRLVYALVGLPPIGASIAYLALLRKVKDREQRYRIVLVAGAILLYVGSGLAARLSASDVVIFATLVLLGLAAACMSLLAYYPPAAIRRRVQEG